MIESVTGYFPELTIDQTEKLLRMHDLYKFWNSRINVISRKDMDNFYLHHVLHSLSIARVIQFKEGTKVMDVGTGGGFPGIPLAVFFPGTHFFLLDSIEKKIKVVSDVAKELQLTNVAPLRKRVEEEKDRYEFIVSRAVTDFVSFVKMTMKNIDKGNRNSLKNGIIYLKGGDITNELGNYNTRVKIWNISEFFSDDFFLTKKIVYLGL